MALSPISPITLEGQPEELSSFLRSGVMYVVWYAPINDTGLKRLHWKAHTAADFTETTPALASEFHNVSALYHPSSDRVVFVWDDGTGMVGVRDGNIYSATFTFAGVIVAGPTLLFPGTNPRLSYRTTPGDQFLLYYVTPKAGGVYGRLSLDGGVSWQSGMPLLTGQVLSTTKIEVVPYDSGHVAIAQLGRDTRGLAEVGMLLRTRPLSTVLALQKGHVLDGNTLALWRLDEPGGTWADQTATYPLTQTGSPISEIGRFGLSRRFTADGQYGSGASDATARGQFTDGEWTVECWFYASTADWTVVPTSFMPVVALGGVGSGGAAENFLFGVQVTHPTREIVFFSQSGVNIFQFGVPNVVFPSLDAWVHIAWRSATDGFGTYNWDAFVNGKFAGRRTLRVAPTGGTNAVWKISGGNPGDPTYSLRGRVDDVRISNGARSDAEIFNSFLGGPPDLYVGEPSKFSDDVTLVDNLRGGLVQAIDNSKLYHLDGVQRGTSDSIGAVAKLTVAGTAITVAASAGPTGNGDDLNEYTLVPAAGTLNVDLPGASFAVALGVSRTHGYVAEYADNSGVLGQFIVVDLGTGTTGTVFSGVTGVRAVAVANFLSPVLIFVASTESGAERLRVYEQNALTPTLLLNTKLPARANSITVGPHPTNPAGARVLVSMVDRFNIYEYNTAASPVILVDSYRFSGGGQFFSAEVAANSNIVVAAGNAGVLVLNAFGKVLAQIQVSGKVVSEWTPNTGYTTGQFFKPRERHQFSRNRMYFRCTTTGTSGSSEPAWAAVGTVIDNTAQWTSQGLLDGVATDVALDEPNKRIYAVGNAGGVLGTDGRVWLISASGLI